MKLPSLKQFDSINGCDFLKEIQAVVDIGRDLLSFIKENVSMLHENRNDVNRINIDSEDVPVYVRRDFENIFISNANAFADPQRSLAKRALNSGAFWLLQDISERLGKNP